mmetsp:Transcript_7257/g.6439  ORF Transcript_7257/g.6439 Transcript_7257/m.6439 type:complete len:137 (-) Transcript_7257:7-417(-)
MQTYREVEMQKKDIQAEINSLIEKGESDLLENFDQMFRKFYQDFCNNRLELLKIPGLNEEIEKYPVDPINLENTSSRLNGSAKIFDILITENIVELVNQNQIILESIMPNFEEYYTNWNNLLKFDQSNDFDQNISI